MGGGCPFEAHTETRRSLLGEGQEEAFLKLCPPESLPMMNHRSLWNQMRKSLTIPNPLAKHLSALTVRNW